MRKLWNAVLFGCALLTSQSAWSDVQPIKLSSLVNTEAIVPMEASEAKPVKVQAETGANVVNHEAKPLSAKDIKQFKKAKTSVKKAAADSEYTEWVREDIGVINDGVANTIASTLNYNFRENENDKVIACSSQTVVMTRKLKSDETKVQFKLCKFLGYSDVIINFDTTTWLGTFENAILDMPMFPILVDSYNAEFYQLDTYGIKFSPATKTITFDGLGIIINSKGEGWLIINDFINIVLPYMNDEFGEWESLGSGTIDNFSGLESIQESLNSYVKEGDKTITFVNNAIEIMARKLKSDPSIVQYKFCNFLGYDDMYFTMDGSLFELIERANIGIPHPSGLDDEGLYGNSIGFGCVVGYVPIQKKFKITNVCFYLEEQSKWMYSGPSFNITLPGGNLDAGFNLTNKISGGNTSKDKSITYSIELKDIDHLRYVVRNNGSGFTFQDIADIAIGKAEYQEATTEWTLVYPGPGWYETLVMAMDADDKYTGLYSTWSLYSNLETPGTWESIGRGTWHYEGDLYGTYWDNTNKEVHYYFPTDKMEWEVEIEKLVDADREVYRVVNPYKLEGCPLADSFKEFMKLSDSEWPPIYENDTYWVEFELCKNGTISFVSRHTGAGGWWMTRNPAKTTYNKQPFEFKDKRLKAKKSLVLDPERETEYFILDFPGYRGMGFKTVESTPEEGDSNGNGVVVGTVGENVEKLLYATIPASYTKPTEAELANIVNDILANPDKYNVYTVSQNSRSTTSSSQVVLPYSISEASWMVIVPVGNDGVAFDYEVAGLKYTSSISNVSMTETLLSFASEESELKGKFTGLTLKKTTDPEKCQDVYTFPNPYVNDPGWYTLLTVTHKDAEDWKFVHDYSGETDNIYFVNCNPGVSIPEIFSVNFDVFLYPIFGDAYKEGDKFYFKHTHTGLEINNSAYNTRGEQYYVIDLSQTESAVSDIAVEDESNMPVEFYDLQGRRIENPASGLYIRRQGSRVSKVLVK